MTEILNIPQTTTSGKRHTHKSGDKYGRWMLTGKSYTDLEGRRKRQYLEGICDCGKVKWVDIYSLTLGKSTSCGCKAIEGTIKRSTKHGHGSRKNRHPVYRLWHDIRQRCENENNPAYKNYGGRGISVCDEWQDFVTFFNWCIDNGWGEGLEIDRIDNNSIYKPINCHFTTPAVQSRNRRSNVIIEAFGEKKCALDWVNSEVCSVCLQTLLNRIRSGVPSEIAIKSPPFGLNNN